MEEEIGQTYDMQEMPSMFAEVMMTGSHAEQALASLTIEGCDPVWKMMA